MNTLEIEKMRVSDFANEVYSILDKERKRFTAINISTPFKEYVKILVYQLPTGEIIGRGTDNYFTLLLPPADKSKIIYDEGECKRKLYILSCPEYLWAIPKDKNVLRDTNITLYGYTGMLKPKVSFQNSKGKEIASVYISAPRIINLEVMYNTITKLAGNKSLDISTITVESPYDVGLEIKGDKSFVDYGISILANYSISYHQNEVLKNLDSILREGSVKC